MEEEIGNQLLKERKNIKKSKMGTKALMVILSVIAFFSFAFVAYNIWFKKTDAQRGETQTVKVVRGDITPTLAVTGIVESQNKVTLNFEVSGKLTEVKVKVGDKVKVGQVLARIDDKNLKRQVAIARANLYSANAKLSQLKAGTSSEDIKVQEVSVNNALKELNKAKSDLDKLQHNSSATKEEIRAAQDKVDYAQGQYDLAVAQLEAKKAGSSSYDIDIQEALVIQAKENYEEALDNLAKATLVSPIAGTVLAVNASVGEQVSAGSQASVSSAATSASSSSNDFIVIADLENLQVKASVDQVDIPKVAKGQSVSISLDALPDKEFKGKVIFVDPNPLSSQDVITYNIIVSIEKPDPKIQLGMTANLKIDLGRRENVLVVPNLALRSVEGQKVVSKLIDGTPTDIPVEVGLSDDDNTEITSGLLEGDEIVISLFLSTGQQSSIEKRMGVPGMGLMFGR